MEKANIMFNGAELGPKFWAEVVDTAHYLFNRSPLSMLEDKTPPDVWINKNHSLSHLKVFGCNAYVHVLKDKRTKLDRKFERCSFIGIKMV